MQVQLEKNGPGIGSPEQMIDSFSSDIQVRQAQWEDRLAQDPSTWDEVQQEINRHFQEGAELLSAALLARVTQRPEMMSHVRDGRQESVVPLRSPERRPLKLRVGQLVVWLIVLSCPPSDQTGETRRQCGGLPSSWARYSWLGVAGK